MCLMILYVQKEYSNHNAELTWGCLESQAFHCRTCRCELRLRNRLKHVWLKKEEHVSVVHLYFILQRDTDYRNTGMYACLKHFQIECTQYIKNIVKTCIILIDTLNVYFTKLNYSHCKYMLYLLTLFSIFIYFIKWNYSHAPTLLWNFHFN